METTQQVHQHAITSPSYTSVFQLRLKVVLFWVLFAAILVPVHLIFQPYFNKADGIIYHFGIVNGTVISPFAQRILLPLVLNIFTQEVWGVVYGMTFISVVTMIAAHMGVFAWMRANGVSERRALIGTALVAFLMPAWYMSYMGIAYPQVEIILLVLALFAMRRNGYSAVIALVIIGTLNRETNGFYIVALYAMWTRNWRTTLLLLAVFGATYGAVRVAFPGVGWWQYGVTLWSAQVQPYQFPTVIVYHTLLLPLWIAFAFRVRHLGGDLRRIVWLLPINLMLFFAFAQWVEVRLLMPAVFLVALPTALNPRRK